MKNIFQQNKQNINFCFFSSHFHASKQCFIKILLIKNYVLQTIKIVFISFSQFFISSKQNFIKFIYIKNYIL